MAAEAPNAAPIAALMPLENEKSDDMKKFIAYLARSDAKHDFNADIVKDATIPNINIGLGVKAGDKLIESEESKCLFSVLGGHAYASMKEFFENQGQDVIFTSGYKTITAGNALGDHRPLHNYLLTKITEPELKGKAFRDECFLKLGASLIIDFNQNGFLSRLDGDAALTGDEQPIYVVTNPQTINDPAPKTKYNDPLFTKQGGALKSCVDLSKDNSIYSSWETDSRHINNMFLTSYQIDLSPVNIVKNMFGHINKLTTNITIHGKGMAGVKYTVKDSKFSNSVSEILKKIKSIVSPNIASNAFKLNEGLQRKRLGDWAQAISCFTMGNRTYNDHTLNISIMPERQHQHIYFVTHDYIAAAYALLIGANVIFLHNDKTVYIFKNQEGRESYIDSIRAILTEATINNVITKLNTYKATRETTLAQLKEFIFDDIRALSTYFNGQAILPDVLKEKCQTIFKKMYFYQQLNQVTPDVTELVKRETYTTAPNPRNPDDHSNIKNAYDKYCLAKNIIAKHPITDLEESVQTRMRNTSVFQSIERWSYSNEVDTAGVSFKLGFRKKDNNIVQNQDKYSFLPFLSTCEEEVKNNSRT